MPRISDEVIEIRKRMMKRVDSLADEVEIGGWLDHWQDLSRYFLTRRGRGLQSRDYDLTNIGSVLEQEGNLAEAKESYQRALSLFEKMKAETEIEFVRQNIQRVEEKLQE